MASSRPVFVSPAVGNTLKMIIIAVSSRTKNVLLSVELHTGGLSLYALGLLKSHSCGALTLRGVEGLSDETLQAMTLNAISRNQGHCGPTQRGVYNLEI